MSDIFLIDEKNNTLVEMKEQPYDSEQILQKLLADYPNLLTGNQINPDKPRKWALVCREASLPFNKSGSGRWSADHLFLDQDGIPTIVEVKRSSDTRIRREIVGQMLDYAANAVVYLSVDTIRAEYEANKNVNGNNTDIILNDFVDDEFGVDYYWNQVKTNLEAGRIRLLFVSDKIPTELKRIIEFLNQQMSPAEVLGVEIKQFTNEDIHTFVPRVVGQTANAQTKKSGVKRYSIQWDEESFFAELKLRRELKESVAAKKILDWAINYGLYTWWGEGKENGSLIPGIPLKQNKYRCYPFSIWTNGKIEVQFSHIKNSVPFDDINMRMQLLNMLNNIKGVSIQENAVDKRPSFQLSCLTNKDSMNKFLEIFEWVKNKLDEFNY